MCNLGDLQHVVCVNYLYPHAHKVNICLGIKAVQFVSKISHIVIIAKQA